MHKMSKIKELFAKFTSTKKSNIIFMAVEIVLVLAIAGGSIAGVAIATMSKPDNKETSSTVILSSSSDISSMEDLSSTEASDISSETVSDVSSVTKREPQYTTTTTIVPTSTAPLTQWPEDQFLPTLPEAASVLDYFISSKLTNEELLMFTSLKGIVNKVQPRIYTCDTDPSVSFGNWTDKLKLKFNKVENPYTLIDKYKKELAGIVIYDDSDKMTSSTINLACTIAGTRSALVVSPALAKILQKKYNFKVIEDLRKPKYNNGVKFTDKWAIYDYMYEHYLDGTSDRVIVGLTPEGIYGFLRDYGIAVGANFIYLDPQANLDAEILNKYFSRLKPGKSVFMGWWLQENDGVNFGSRYGVVTLASDFSQNLSVYAGMNKNQKITPMKTAKAPKLENKIYISLMIADGDNLQYCEGYLQGVWDQSERGDFPISWTMTPAMADIAKPLVNYYHKTATQNDCLISGPSAYGYTYPRFWFQQESTLKALPKFLQLSDKYMKKLGWRSITVWNWSTGAMKQNELKVYADNMPSLLGISQQENMDKPQYLFNNKFLVTQLDGSYCGEYYQLEQICTTKINQFYDQGASKPVFVTLQAVPWSVGGSLKNLANLYQKVTDQCGTDVEFVRFDQMLQLMTADQKSK